MLINPIECMKSLISPTSGGAKNRVRLAGELGAEGKRRQGISLIYKHLILILLTERDVYKD